MQSDLELIEQCKKGKHSAFEALYKKYATRMMGIAMRYVNTTFEAEDIIQDAFIRVFQKINTFDAKGSVEGWLRRVVVNTAINHYHKTLKERYQEDYTKLYDQETDIEDCISKINNEELMNIVHELPEGYRMVFNLYIIEGYNHKEIGELLKISEGTSKSQLSKARNYLKELLIKYNYITHE